MNGGTQCRGMCCPGCGEVLWAIPDSLHSPIPWIQNAWTNPSSFHWHSLGTSRLCNGSIINWMAYKQQIFISHSYGGEEVHDHGDGVFGVWWKPTEGYSLTHNSKCTALFAGSSASTFPSFFHSFASLGQCELSKMQIGPEASCEFGGSSGPIFFFFFSPVFQEIRQSHLGPSLPSFWMVNVEALRRMEPWVRMLQFALVSFLLS